MTDTAGRSILLVGATSSIGHALALELAQAGDHWLLVGRNEEELSANAGDLATRRRCSVDTDVFDAMDLERTSEAVERWCAALPGGGPDGVLVCHGFLPSGDSPASLDEIQRSIAVNFTSVVAILDPLAARMAERQRGWICAVSSVAGDRGRQSNYLYGAAKAGLSTFLQGLRNRMAPAGVHVLTVKPGFVDTPMLRSQMEGDSPLIATPARVAKSVARALRRRQNEVYAPWFWAPIMLVIRSIPEPIFKRMSL